MKRLKKIFFPIIIGLFLVSIFYHPFIFKHLIPAPLDIIPGMYLPWLDQRRDVFPNGGPVKNPLPSDVVSLTLPLRKLAIDMFKNKEWPLWNQSILLGTPLLSNFQSAALNPLNLLYLLPLPFIDVWSFQIILQSFLAFLSFYVFIHQFKLSKSSEIIGSFIWAFNGFFIIWFQYNTVVYAAIFLPLILFCITKIKNSYIWGFLISFLLVFSVFAGNPPITLIVFGATTLFTIFNYRKDLKNILISFIFISLSLVYSSPQLLPGFHSSANSIRNYDNVAVSENIKFLYPVKLITTIIPDFFGNPSTRNTWNKFPLYDNTTIYNGILSVIFFVLSFKIKKNNHQKQDIKYFAYLISAITFLVMIDSPISNLIGKLNILGLSSMVFTRFSILWSLSLAILSAIVFDSLEKKEFKTKDLIFSCFTVFISIATLATISFYLNRYFIKTGSDYDWIIQTKTAFRNCFYPLIFVVFYSILILLLNTIKYSKIKKIISLLLIVLLIFDIYRFFSKYNSFSSVNDFYPKSELTDYLSQNSFRFIRESSELIPSNMWSMYPNLKTPSGYDTTYSKYYGQFISLINGGSLSNSTNRYLEIDNFNSNLINLLSADYLVATKKSSTGLDQKGNIPTSLNKNQFSLVKDFGTYVVLKNNQNLPYIRGVANTIFIDDENQIKDFLTKTNLTNTALIDSPNNSQNNLNTNFEITNVSIQQQKIIFNFKSKEDTSVRSFLVISQNFDDGWKLKIDGQENKIYRTNHTFIGFYIPTGSHNINLIYQPDIFYFSLKMSIVVTTISIVFLLFKLAKTIHR